MQDHRHGISEYYDRITPYLLSRARRRTGIMHQEVWGPEVADRRGALLYVSGLVERALAPVLERASPPALVVDLGCGIGGSAARLARRGDVSVIGLTLSHVQARRAAGRVARSDTPDRCLVVVADYMQPPLPRTAIGAYALDSFAHAPRAAGFFRAAGEMIVSGGRLIICEDVVAAPAPPGPDDYSSWLSKFRAGWRLTSLVTGATLKRHAVDNGFLLLEEIDLTPLARRPSRFGRLASQALAGVLPPGPIKGALVGAMARDVCRRAGALQYRFFVFGRIDA